MKSQQVYSLLLAVTAAVVTGAPHHTLQEHDTYLPPARDVVVPESDYLPPTIDVAVPDGDYLPPAIDVAVPDGDYLPPGRDVVVPESDYLPPARDQNVQQEVLEEFLSNPNPSYSVSYAVEAPETRDQKQAEESQSDGVTKGSYQYLRPDGVLQVVKYVVTKEGGYQAEVEERPGFAPITQEQDIKNSAPESEVTALDLDLEVVPPSGNIVQISSAHFALNHPLAQELLANSKSPVATSISFTPISVPSPTVPALPTSTFLTLPSPASEVKETVPLSEFQKISNPVFPPTPVFPVATLRLAPGLTDSKDSLQTPLPATLLTNTKLSLPAIPATPVAPKIQVPFPALSPAFSPVSPFPQVAPPALASSSTLLQAPSVTFTSPHTSFTYFSS